ncbi:MAG: hypothetical protein RMI35_08995 [Leptospiraceae bacterium]|nr:hypothetical protein [Leptospiraceae bacterium]
MKEEVHTETEIEVLPYREAIDYVQSLESRGDFKYKGIYTIFNAILEATNKFQTHKVLLDYYQLQKDINLPKDKFEEYIKELIGKGSLKANVVIMFPAVDFIVSGGYLTSHLILCRPLQNDGISYKRYFDYYKTKSIDAIQKWIQRKNSKWQGDHRDFILKNLNEHNYYNSHAGAVIQYYLQNPLDKTPLEKALTYRVFVKPIIQDLINEKLISYVKKDNFFTLQFPDEESLRDRMQLLLSRLSMESSLFTFTGDYQIPQLEQFLSQIQNADVKSRNLHQELLILIEELIKLYKIKEEQEKKQKLQKAIEELQKIEFVIPTQNLKSLSQVDFVTFISQPDVLHTEFLINNRVLNFVLHKKNAFPAIVHARKQFYEKNDDTEIRVLMQLEIHRYLQGEQLKIYQSVEDDVLFSHLPWFVKLIRMLFGKEKVKPEEKEKLKEKLKQEEVQRQIQSKQKEAQIKTKEIAKQKIAQKSIEEFEEEKTEELEEERKKVGEVIQRDEKAEELLEKVLDVLDEAWSRKELPNRLTLIERIPEFQKNEDFLIQFLKKYGKGKIFSFRILPHNPESPKINLNDPKYQWPVLISKRYIARNGNRLLKEAMEEVDAQKKALMPDQEKFDVATSIEDFLVRVLSKKV